VACHVACNLGHVTTMTRLIGLLISTARHCLYSSASSSASSSTSYVWRHTWWHHTWPTFCYHDTAMTSYGVKHAVRDVSKWRHMWRAHVMTSRVTYFLLPWHDCDVKWASSSTLWRRVWRHSWWRHTRPTSCRHDINYCRRQAVRWSTDRLLVSRPVHPISCRLHQRHLLG